jgi:hypothetical protein
MDHLVEDRREFIDDLEAEGGREALPQLLGSAGHGTPHSSARARKS